MRILGILGDRLGRKKETGSFGSFWMNAWNEDDQDDMMHEFWSKEVWISK